MANIDNFDKTSLAALWGNKIKPGLGGKIDKVPSATSGHLAKFNGSGQVVDGDTAENNILSAIGLVVAGGMLCASFSE